MRSGLVLSIVSLSLLAGAPSALAATTPGPAAKPKPHGHKHKKKCTKGKVPLTVNGGRRCVPLKAALPRPKEADQRLLAAQAALDLDLSKAHDRRGRPVLSAKQVLGARRLRNAEGAVKKGLGILDQLEARAALSSISSPIAAASKRGCGGGPENPEASKGFSSKGLGANVELSKAGASIGIDVEEGGIRAEIDMGLCDLGGDKLKIPECPDAEGMLEGSDESLLFMDLKIFKGSEKLFAEKLEFSAKTEVKPVQVDDEAKLEYFEIDHTYHSNIEVGGATQAFSRIALNVTYHGHAVVRYPGATYDPTGTEVDVRIGVDGVDDAHEVHEVEFDESQKAKPEADKNFAAEIDKVIKKLAGSEAHWNKPNECAEVKFEPASESLKLKRSEHGSLKAKVQSRKGGSPPSANWSLANPQNATMGPTSAHANPATFTYVVTNAGSGAIVSGTFRVRSRAGVAEGEWKQRTKEIESINQIKGNFGGEFSIETALGIPITQRWTGIATFDRNTPSVLGGASGAYKLSEGSVSITASGIDGTGITGCHQSGFLEEPLKPGAGSVSVQGSGLEQEPPYSYSIQVQLPLGMLEITRENCPEGAAEFEGTKEKIGALWSFTTHEGESTDGKDYLGLKREKFGADTFEEFWTFHGTP